MNPFLSVLKAWVGLGLPEVRAPPIIATRAVFSIRMSCDAVESESNAQLPRSTLPSNVSESYEEP